MCSERRAEGEQGGSRVNAGRPPHHCCLLQVLLPIERLGLLKPSQLGAPLLLVARLLEGPLLWEAGSGGLASSTSCQQLSPASREADTLLRERRRMRASATSGRSNGWTILHIVPRIADHSLRPLAGWVLHTSVGFCGRSAPASPPWPLSRCPRRLRRVSIAAGPGARERRSIARRRRRLPPPPAAASVGVSLPLVHHSSYRLLPSPEPHDSPVLPAEAARLQAVPGLQRGVRRVLPRPRPLHCVGLPQGDEGALRLHELPVSGCMGGGLVAAARELGRELAGGAVGGAEQRPAAAGASACLPRYYSRATIICCCVPLLVPISLPTLHHSPCTPSCLPQHGSARGAQGAVCGGGQPTQPRLGQAAGGAVGKAASRWTDSATS